MIPRLPTSKKWTSLPAELCTQIREVFEEGFAELANVGKMHVEGRIYPDELLLRVGYSRKSLLRQANFEVSIDFKSEKQNALAEIHFAVDCAASMMQEYADKAQDLSDFPRTWSSIKLEKNIAFIQVSTVNTDLEMEADKILGEESAALIQEEEATDETYDREAIVSMLGLDDENVSDEVLPDHNDHTDCNHDHTENDTNVVRPTAHAKKQFH